MKQFCIKGHDKLISGRMKDGACRLCHHNNAPIYRKRLCQKRREILNRLKDKPCTDCGIKYPSYVMQWDHISVAKKTCDPSKLINYNYEKTKQELSLCELVCANCHAARTWSRKQYTIRKYPQGETYVVNSGKSNSN